MGYTSIELFCGKGEISQALTNLGFATFKIDRRKRTNTCEPDLRKNILNLSRAELPKGKVNFVWASPPCIAFTNASSHYYMDAYGNLNENAKEHLRVLRRTLNLIEEINPDFYMIENPRGRMRYEKSMVDFQTRMKGICVPCTLSSYGFPTAKPTDIFTNLYTLLLDNSAPFGTGAKGSQVFNKLTTDQRQQTPPALALAIAEQVKKSIDLKYLQGENVTRTNVTGTCETAQIS